MRVTDLTLLEHAAIEAGKIAMRYWRKDPQAWEKDDDAGPVTEADLAVNDYLEDVLRSARPDYGWLSEESVDDPSRLDARHCFIIDPIDGTRAFIAGQEGFSHSLAIATEDRITAGVVHLPARAMTYSAEADSPARLNGKSIAPVDHALQGATVLTGKPSLDPVFWRGQVPPVTREFRPSLAWRLCLVAEGRFNAALSTRAAWEWDIAAGSLIAERAGCRVTALGGRPMRFNTQRMMLDGLVIAAPVLHGAMIEAMSPPQPA